MGHTISDTLTSGTNVTPASADESKAMAARPESLASQAQGLLEFFCKKISLISIITCGIMPIPIVADVLTRLFIGKSISGIIELEEFMMVLIVFLSLAITQWQRGQISIDLLFSRLSERKQVAVQYFNDTACFILR